MVINFSLSSSVFFSLHFDLFRLGRRRDLSEAEKARQVSLQTELADLKRTLKELEYSAAAPIGTFTTEAFTNQV